MAGKEKKVVVERGRLGIASKTNNLSWGLPRGNLFGAPQYLQVNCPLLYVYICMYAKLAVTYIYIFLKTFFLYVLPYPFTEIFPQTAMC